MAEKTDVIIDALSPKPASVRAGNLEYGSLRGALAQSGFLSALKKSSEVLRGRRKIPSLGTVHRDFYIAYLLNASYRLQHARTAVERFFWSQQFSASSIQLFGRPSSRVVAVLAAEELRFFERVVVGLGDQSGFAQPLLATYRKLARSGAVREVAPERKYKDALDAVHDYFYAQYENVLAVFDTYEADYMLYPDDIFRSFSEALAILQRQDVAWEKWQVVMVNSGNLSVSSRSRRISIGRHRVPASVYEARGLFAHEVLVHARRAVNGEKRSKDLRRGLNGYLVAEEGLGVLAETAVNDTLAYKVKDRYLDIALALGSYRRRSLAREELFIIVYVRAVLRSLVDGSTATLEDIEKACWQHVNRIYRGTLGNNYVGVFTKDIAYYEGFVKMSQYVSDQLKTRPIEAIMSHVLSGKFDPTNTRHQKTVRRRR